MAFIGSQWLMRGTCVALGVLWMQACELPNYAFEEQQLPRHCGNARQDSGESGVDCGGDCSPCCPDGFGECDSDLSEACETNVKTSQQHCGACDAPCSPDNGTGSCAAGVCRVEACEEPYADCNRDASDGCEANLNSNASNCGACEAACPGVNGEPSCVEGSCQIECSDGYGNCNNELATGWQDGCEKSVLSDVKHCGSCGNECPGKAGETAFCRNGACGSTLCERGLGDCDGNSEDGCESDLNTDALNCGGCGNDCSSAFANAEPDCAAGDCVLSSCKAGFGNCNASAADGGRSDGCETNLSTDAQNCGSCGASCVFPNATGRCVGGECVIDRCVVPYSDCDEGTATGCEANLLTDAKNCGGCAAACLTANARTTSCSSGACRPACSAGWGACTDPAAGCTTPLDTVQNCGRCGQKCAGTTPFCVDAACSAQMKIVLMNSSTVGAAFNELRLTHSLQSPRGQRRLVLLALASTGAVDTAQSAKPEVVTYGGTAMREFQPLPFGGLTTYTSFYYLTDQQLPATVGSQQVVIDARPGTPSMGSTQLIANVLEFRNVEQASPIEELFKRALPNCAMNPPTHSVVVAYDGSLLYSLAAFQWGEPSSIVGNLTSTLEGRVDSGAALNVRGGYRASLAPGTYTVGWPRSDCVSYAHHVIALRPAVTP